MSNPSSTACKLLPGGSLSSNCAQGKCVEAEVVSRLSPGRGVVLFWTGVCRQHRLYRPRQLCHQYSGGHGVRIRLAVGAAVVERHGDSDPVPLCQVGNCDGTDLAAELPGPL